MGPLSVDAVIGMTFRMQSQDYLAGALLDKPQT